MLAALVGLAAVLLTGCVKMQADFVINSDDTFDASIVMAYSDSALESMAAMSGMSIEEAKQQIGLDSQIADIESEFGSDAKVEPYSEGGYSGSKVSFKGQPLSELGKGTGDGDLTITREGDKFILNGSFDASDMGGMEDMPDLGEEMTPKIVFTFAFPGKVTSSTGKVSGNKVTFDIVIGQVNDIQAEAGAKGSGGGGGGSAASGSDDKSSPLMLILIIAGAVLVIAVVVIVIVMASSKKKKKAADAAPAAPGAMGYPPPVQPGPYGQPPAQGYAPPAAPPAQGYAPPAAPPAQGFPPPQDPYGQPPAPPAQGFPPPQAPYGQPPAPPAAPADPYGQPPVAPPDPYGQQPPANQ